MSVEQFVDLLGRHWPYLLIYFCVPPILGVGFGLLGARFGFKPWICRIQSLLIYMVSIPGMAAAVIVGYMIFFSRHDLLKVNVIVYFLPLVSMLGTLACIRKFVSFELLPGFDRLSGLMTLLAVTFFVLLSIYKTRIFIGFFSSIQSLILIGVFVFGLLKYSTGKLMK